MRVRAASILGGGAFLAVFAAAGVDCTHPTELVVVVDSKAGEIDEVVITVDGVVRDQPVGASPAFPLYMSVSSASNSEAPVTIVVSGKHAHEEIAVRTVVVDFVKNESRTVHFTLCVGSVAYDPGSPAWTGSFPSRLACEGSGTDGGSDGAASNDGAVGDGSVMDTGSASCVVDGGGNRCAAPRGLGGCDSVTATGTTCDGPMMQLCTDAAAYPVAIFQAPASDKRGYSFSITSVPPAIGGPIIAASCQPAGFACNKGGGITQLQAGQYFAIGSPTNLCDASFAFTLTPLP